MFGVLFLLFCFVNVSLLQGIGSGTDGKLRICVVDARGTFRRSQHYCPVLDAKNADVECVLGTDRLDCLRRISKGTVDFGVFSPEDLVAAQWASLDLLVTNEIRLREKKPFERSVVALVNKRILPDSSSSIHVVLRNSSLCHPGIDADHLRPLSDSLTGYLESLVLERSCDPELSMAENRIRALSRYFGEACRAGLWVPDARRDAELKQKYPSLCAACSSPGRCSAGDRYWGDSGVLQCVEEGAGDVGWLELDDVIQYFGLNKSDHDLNVYPPTRRLAYLCRDGTWRDVGTEPCVWLYRPWNVVVAKRKVAAQVAALTATLTNATALELASWRGALLQLLDSSTALRPPLAPPQTPQDYLERATGFREAYSQSGCDPPRYITICSTSLLESHKCEWLAEAGAVYGVSPPLQCSYRRSPELCMAAASAGAVDVAIGDSDWLVKGDRDLNLTTILHEITPIVEKTNSITAYVRKGANINKMADLRGKRAAFPRYDGFAWHAAILYFKEAEKISCKEFESDFFEEVCAPGGEGNSKVQNCYEDGGKGALESLLAGKSDVAFVDMATFKMMTENQTSNATLQEIAPLCPEENKKYCFISWSSIGHVFVSKNATTMRKQEIINVLGRFDQLFGRTYPFRSPMFSMYGAFNHKMDLLFHGNTKNLAHDSIFSKHPYDTMPLNFESKLLNATDFLCSFGGRLTPSWILAVTFVAVIFY